MNNLEKYLKFRKMVDTKNQDWYMENNAKNVSYNINSIRNEIRRTIEERKDKFNNKNN